MKAVPLRLKRINLFTIGAGPPAWALAAENKYRRQIQLFTLQITTLKPQTSPNKEAEHTLARLPKRASVALLDVRGRQTDSSEFATLLRMQLEAPHPPVYVIAGAGGAGAKLKQAADTQLSLSPLTFPHALARLIFVEQCFRADCIMRNHPYPR